MDRPSAEGLRHGLVRGSFIPDHPQRELRELVRYRCGAAAEQRSQVVDRTQKVLEGANIKLSSVATDVVGASGRAMLEAMVAGEEQPKALAARKKDSYLAAQYHRIAARRGKKRAILAVAHSVLVIIYPMLRDGSSYADLGGDYFDERNRESTKKRPVQRLQPLGYTVTLLPARRTFSYQSSMPVVTGTTEYENGHPGGCLRLYFQRNPPCRLSPAPRSMKMVTLEAA